MNHAPDVAALMTVVAKSCALLTEQSVAGDEAVGPTAIDDPPSDNPLIDTLTDDQVIDLNDLPPTREDDSVGGRRVLGWTQQSGASDMMLREMSIVKSRIGFDEQQFRDDCQRLQAALSGEFKKIVDSIYDSLDTLVANYSRQMYQIQVDSLRVFEEDLSEIRKINIQAATISQSLSGFCANMQEAFRSTFDGQ